MKLTQKTVDTVLYEGRSHMDKRGRKRWSQHLLWDDKVPGLGLRISATNRKSFFVSYRAGGRKRSKTLGTTAKLTLKEARAQATDLLASVAEELPAAAPQATLDGVDTVSELADAYLEQHLKANVPSWFADQRLIRTHIKPAIGRSLIADVTPADLSNLRSRVGKRFPADRRRVSALLKGMFDWAAERGLWSKRTRDARRAAARDSKATKSPAEEPAALPDAAELMASLRKEQAERAELAAQLEEVSASGAEMLITLNEQAAAQKKLEAKLARSQRELERARADAGLPERERTDKKVANLQHSVEQLMDQLEKAKTERQQAIDQLAPTEARVLALTEKVGALSRARDELESKAREEERQKAARRARRRQDPGRQRITLSLAAGAIGGAALVLLFQAARGPGATAPSLMPTDETSVATRPTISSSELTEPTGQPTSAAEPVAAAPPAASAAQEPPLTPAQPATPAGAAADEGGYQADRQPDFAAVEEAVAAWAAAWSEQRVDDYLAAYSRKFVPTGGLGRGEWAAQRRSRVLRPASIRVSLGAVSQTVAGADRVEVTFEQSYETDTYSDRVTKRLDLVWEDGGWKITAEKAD